MCRTRSSVPAASMRRRCTSWAARAPCTPCPSASPGCRCRPPPDRGPRWSLRVLQHEPDLEAAHAHRDRLAILLAGREVTALERRLRRFGQSVAEPLDDLDLARAALLVDDQIEHDRALERRRLRLLGV